MSYTTFRDAYLTEAENRLASVNVSTASTNDLLIAGALYKMAAAVAEVDLLGPSALRLLETMTGSQLEAWLQSASNREAFERILSSPEAMRAVAASSQAMAAVLASSNAWAAVVANSQAMAAVAANSQAMAAVLANSNAWAAVVANSQAMAAVLDSQVARGAVWGSSTALIAIQNAPSAVLDALQSHPRVSMMNNAPSNLQVAFISGKSMTLRVRNASGSDTNYLRDLAGGSGSGNDSFSTSTTWQTRVRAYNDIRHYNWSNNYTFQAYVVNMN